MKKLFTILFLSLCATTYSQTFYYPVVIKQTLRVDGKVAIGGVTFDRDFTVTADTIRIKNLDGTGTILGIDVNGDVTRVTGVGAAGVTGLNDYEPLFGSLTGTIEQDNFWYYDPTTQFMRLGDPAGTAGGEIYVVNGTTGSNMTPTSVGVTGSVGQTYMDGQYFNLYDLDGEFFSIGRATWSADEVLLFPAAKGALNQSLYVSNVSGDNVTFSWYTPAAGTVTSFSATDGNGFDFTVTNPTTTPNLTLTTTVSDNQVMYSNGGALGGSPLFTWDDAAGVERLDVKGYDFYFRGSTTYTSSLIAADDGGTVYLGDANTNVNGTSIIIDDPSETIVLKADNGVKISNFAASDVLMYFSDATEAITPVTLTANDFNFSGGTLSIDYTNGQTASTSTKGFLTDTDWDIFNDKTGKVGTAVNLTGQNAPIAATTIYTTPATDGFYQVNWVASITTAGTTSILGPFKISFTNASDNVVKTYPTSAVSFYNQTNANTTGASIGGSFTVYCKASTDIRYIMGRTSTGTAMVYDLNIQIVKL